mmetsp:Transcript_36146/g.35100  ORF Transcript_36146/g.35100 Transcript_36146/m.35100 type:complete len:142 (+) Transcript_36146:3-428(+)
MELLVCDQFFCFINSTCSSIKHYFMDLTFTFDLDLRFTLTPESYLLNGLEFGMNNTCVLGMMGGLSKNDPYVLGAIFLKNLYVVFDMDKKRVGISYYKQTEEYKFEGNKGIFFLILITAISILALLFLTCYLIRRRRIVEN